MEGFIFVIFLICLVIGCSGPNKESSDLQNTNTSIHANQYNSNYINSSFLGPSSNEDDKTLYFHGYECTDDCSGHEAGYEWAERKGIDDIDDCSTRSDSFNEGCKAYVNENY